MTSTTSATPLNDSVRPRTQAAGPIVSRMSDLVLLNGEAGFDPSVKGVKGPKPRSEMLRMGEHEDSEHRRRSRRAPTVVAA